MFQSIEILDEPEVPRTFKLTDSTFTRIGFLERYVPQDLAREVFIILEYKKRNLAVSKNLARSYIKYEHHISVAQVLKWVADDARRIDSYLPDLEFSKKYLSCVSNQVRQLYPRRVHGN
jgi:hypothetical protein